MVKDIDSLRIRLRRIAAEEEEYKKSKRIVYLEEAPECKTVIYCFNKRNDPPKVKRIISHIEENYLVKIFKDKMDIYKDISRKSNFRNKSLEKLSKKYKVNLGELHGVKGNYHETEDKDLDLIIKRLAKLRH